MSTCRPSNIQSAIMNTRLRDEHSRINNNVLCSTHKRTTCTYLQCSQCPACVVCVIMAACIFCSPGKASFLVKRRSMNNGSQRQPCPFTDIYRHNVASHIIQRRLTNNARTGNRVSTRLDGIGFTQKPTTTQSYGKPSVRFVASDIRYVCTSVDDSTFSWTCENLGHLLAAERVLTAARRAAKNTLVSRRCAKLICTLHQRTRSQL